MLGWAYLEIFIVSSFKFGDQEALYVELLKRVDTEHSTGLWKVSQHQEHFKREIQSKYNSLKCIDVITISMFYGSTWMCVTTGYLWNI